MTADRPFLGVMLMLGFCVLAPLGDSIAKLLGGDVGLGVLVLVRFAVQGAILVPVVLLFGKGLRPPKGTMPAITLRTCLHICGIALMFSALRYLPLADALAIAFVMPFIMLLLGRFVLGEEVGPQRMWACAVGFVGTLLVIQPNFAAVGWPALLPLGVAFVFSFFMLVTRTLAKRIDAVQLQALSGIQATGLLLLILLVLPDMTATRLSLPVGAVPLLLALGVIGTLAHLLMTWSLRFAPSATVAPMQYLEIPIGTLIGWIVFSDLPNGLAAIGICITITAGLYIIVREQRLSRSPGQTGAA